MLQTVNVRYAVPDSEEGQFEGLFNRVAEVLHERLEAMDPSVGATVSDRVLDVTLTVEALSPDAALSMALDTIPRIFQAAGYNPYWPMLKSVELLEAV